MVHLSDDQPEYIYTWGNNLKRATLKGRRCVVLARGKKGSILVAFLDSGQCEVISRRAIRRAG